MNFKDYFEICNRKRVVSEITVWPKWKREIQISGRQEGKTLEDKRDLYRGDRDSICPDAEEAINLLHKATSQEVEQEQPGYPDWGETSPIVHPEKSLVIGPSGASGRYLRYDLIPMDVLKEVVEVLTFGQEKHVQNAQGEGESWTAGQLYSVRINKILRHLTSFIEGDIIDSESGRHALAHVIVQAMFLLGMDLTGQYHKFDDRSRLNGESRKPEEK